MKRFFAAFAAALSILFASCAGEQRVVIISTNDIHSAIDGFPRLATLVEGVRDSVGEERVLLVDAGDRWTGNPFVDLANPPLSPVVELMNELGYDIATLGNHEFDWGQELLGERTGQMRFPVVCANVVADASAGAELDPVAPYAFVEAGGIRFAFLGMVTNFSRWGRPEGKAEHFAGLTFPDVWQTAESYASLADSADVFVGLVHLGHAREVELAERVPQFDLIVGGDSHTVVSEPVLVGKTVVTQAGSKLKYAGITTVTRARSGKTTIENRLVMLDTIAPAPRFEEMVRRYNENPELLSPIGATAEPLDEDGVNNLVVDAMRAATGADIALYHSGGIRIDTLFGAVSIADLHRIEPFLSEVYTLHMTPGQIKGMVMNKFNDPNPKESHAPDIVPAGIAYTITTDEAGEATDVVFDRPERQRYLVAMPDYLYKNYIFDRSEEAVETGRMVTSVLHDYISRHNPLKPDNTERIVIK